MVQAFHSSGYADWILMAPAAYSLQFAFISFSMAVAPVSPLAGSVPWPTPSAPTQLVTPVTNKLLSVIASEKKLPSAAELLGQPGVEQVPDA